jgi:hypothetical protein
MVMLCGLVSEELQFVTNLHIIKPHLNWTQQHHRSAFFYPHKILFEIHRVFGFFCFRILIFTDFIQSPIIFFWQRDLTNPRLATDFPSPGPKIFCGNTKWKNVFLTSQEWFALFLCTKSKLFTFSICNIQLPSGYGLHSLMQSLMLECVALF